LRKRKPADVLVDEERAIVELPAAVRARILTRARAAAHQRGSSAMPDEDTGLWWTWNGPGRDWHDC